MLDVAAIRRQFPAMNRPDGRRLPVFLDGPGGTQVPQRVIDAVTQSLSFANANRGGVFRTSRAADAMLDEAHRAVADLLNALSPDEVFFGQNMTSLWFQVSRSISRTWKPGDEVMVTRLDHDANIRPWVLAAEDAGATVRWVDIRPEDCTLDLESFQKQLSPRTKLVALPAASNACGTRVDLPPLIKVAKEAGALVAVDAVHYAPHGPIDVQAWGCDVLGCSAYKFFGPHVGIAWARRELLEQWRAYRVRPAGDSLPGRWMTGTQNHEGIAGTLAAIEYLACLISSDADRRTRLHAAMDRVRQYERGLARRLLEGLAARPRYRVHGIAQLDRLEDRVPTFAITSTDRPASDLAEHLARYNIYTWAGNFYAIELIERLGLLDRGGVLRVGLVHYNAPEDVDLLLAVLDRA
jgi:cysteine desulfurase family protein (TIGR01976 family)